MHKLCDLLRQKHRRKSECRPLARQLLQTVRELAESGFAALSTLARTLSSWSEEIACMWRFTKNNGITEGFHRAVSEKSNRRFHAASR